MLLAEDLMILRSSMYFVNSLKLQFNLSFKVKRTLFNPVYLMKLKVIFVCLFYRKKKSDHFG